MAVSNAVLCLICSWLRRKPFSGIGKFCMSMFSLSSVLTLSPSTNQEMVWRLGSPPVRLHITRIVCPSSTRAVPVIFRTGDPKMPAVPKNVCWQFYFLSQTLVNVISLFFKFNMFVAKNTNFKMLRKRLVIVKDLNIPVNKSISK